ncbi:hypothetical protein [Achromobacter arsenitoxydans]|uniref:Uncharacterized protein n=1 Tax=Achromobacter arsenitoxydans SY8 TaxID=477184 RepID=H0F734_9BURK|nr:hypothetical protein [Achromobacter arsenitoxydans]EHK65948.1 hypothetical protein KYC_12503 [Achromobacter arsenitoxydans SY8]
MSEILNLKHTLPDTAQAHYISQEQIEASRDPCSAIGTVAHVLVSERHGKFDLVHLVAHLMEQKAALAAQLCECAETLGADKIDEQRAMRAYADAMALLAEMSHLSSTPGGDASLKEL